MDKTFGSSIKEHYMCTVCNIMLGENYKVTDGLGDINCC